MLRKITLLFNCSAEENAHFRPKKAAPWALGIFSRERYAKIVSGVSYRPELSRQDTLCALVDFW